MTNVDYALFITGNPGSGKSFIANNLGANFRTGFSMHGGGVTTEVQSAEVTIESQRVLLVDAPGLIEADYQATQRNAGMITDALGISRHTPCKIGVIVTDHNGRIQQADLLLIKKVHEALTPAFEFLLIVNQIRRRNITNYATRECLTALVQTIQSRTGADVRIDRVIAIADFEPEQRPDMAPLIRMLGSINQQSAEDVKPIVISTEEHQSLGEKILFYVYRTLKIIASLAGPMLMIGQMIM
ncbi:hypothetical protein BX616_000904 [Lobosporangium transversale]|uniref:G domain-containing protein n=1 Tax=Lobosporangium transversale TaxID=64571 RepID=A0A1Y2GD94_9FUNG|nr:hypothetical protein BCR41DRAFT_399705 [Lobosporangium transversale]KAF9905868.1 hypothetical protein BX616_000904 [Lobosporangium transversale]ORZ07557.1 hypothetical protein BCR41DRAFT_399705 [Lobosporangium transversale]|eukprot:XP_021878064.1 hypothetical protein BCR41DRAFT_399705 [Lobosporangium transversale]